MLAFFKMSLWTCFKSSKFVWLCCWLFTIPWGRQGLYQHPANPNPSAVKYLLFGKHPFATDVSFWCCYRPYQGLSRYKPEKFNRRVLSKLVFRLLERFNVDPGMGYCNILWSYLSNKEQRESICLLPCSSRNLCCHLSWGISGFN